jgi:Family of unknown function (DUF6262)
VSLDRDRRIATLGEANQRRSAASLQRCETAIAALTHDGQRITVNAVARRAGVSRSFIYAHNQLLARIRALADAEPRLRAPSVTARASDESLRRRLADALDRIRDLTAERDALRNERETLLGENRELRRAAREQKPH